MKLSVLEAAKTIYTEGRNVTDFLRKTLDQKENSQEMIEFVYDLQAGTYVERTLNNPDHATAYSAEMARLLSPHFRGAQTILDIGTGELTSLSLMLKHLETMPEHVLAFDISWSRIQKGLPFARSVIGENFGKLDLFVADIQEIPLPAKSIDVVISSHALEPNGGSLDALLAELFRICRGKLVLFEPSYERNSAEGRDRMERMGYIRDLPGAVARQGGRLIEMVPITNVANPLNPTFCHVVEPSPAQGKVAAPGAGKGLYTVPGTDYPLTLTDGVLYSKDTGLAFPMLRDIPVLRLGKSFLASALG